jgi:hypothetical protein
MLFRKHRSGMGHDADAALHIEMADGVCPLENLQTKSNSQR